MPQETNLASGGEAAAQDTRLNHGSNPLKLAEPANGQQRLATSSPTRLVMGLVLPAILCAFVCISCLLPLRTTVSIGADEGFELAKTELDLRGHRLYSEVWNDQPPLHTFLTTAIVRSTEKKSTTAFNGPAPSNVVKPAHSPLGPRALSIAMAALLLLCLFTIVNRIHGNLVAAVAIALLIASPGFIELSASCMLEIPALSLAVTSVALLVSNAHIRLRSLRLLLLKSVVAGTLFGLALQIKLVPATLLPLVALLLWSNSILPSGHLFSVASLKRLLLTGCAFGLALLVAYIGIDALIERGAFLINFKQTLTSHFGAAKSFEYGSAADHPFDWPGLLRHWDTTLPAVVGALLLVRAFLGRSAIFKLSTFNFQPSTTPGSQPSAASFQRSSTPILHQLPLLWLVLTFAVFTLHKPWWPYYYIHLAVPLSWCASIAIVFLIHKTGSPVGKPATCNLQLSTVPRFQLATSLLLASFFLCTTAWQTIRVYL